MICAKCFFAIFEMPASTLDTYAEQFIGECEGCVWHDFLMSLYTASSDPIYQDLGCTSKGVVGVESNG